MPELLPAARKTGLVRRFLTLMDTPTLAGVAARRSALYWLLADLFGMCPNDALITRLHRSLACVTGARTDDPLAAGVAALRNALPEIHDAAGITELAVEYTRLFGGISASYGMPPPHESMYRDAPVPAERAVAVTQCYFDAGFAAVDQGVPPDHLRVELKFVALLCHSESEAWQCGRNEEAVHALRRQRDFLDGHLLRWAPDYWGLVRAEAQHDFFVNLATVALEAVTDDRSLIENLLVDFDTT